MGLNVLKKQRWLFLSLKKEVEKMANYIGIDLGTTFSAVATLDETGRPIIIKNEGHVDHVQFTQKVKFIQIRFFLPVG